jgi:alpha-L-fucosidase
MDFTRRRFMGGAAAAAFASRMPLAELASTTSFVPELESLRHYRAPAWFRDAKLGIWACWGPESVPEMGDWYARNMYIEGHVQYEDHLRRYGHPSTVGYKDMVPLWRAENWQPERLMGLYKKAGARYFCAIAQHHDNIDCWNSRFHPWNSVKMGPKRDVIGIWRDTARQAGLRFGVTEHLGASWNWYGETKHSDTRGPKAGVPYDGTDIRYASLYHWGNEHSRVQSWYRGAPEAFQMEWFYRIRDLVDSYQPDLLYSDGSLPFGGYGRRLLAHFYNENEARHGGELDAVYNCKFSDDGGQYVDGMCVQDLERGVALGIRELPWQTDTCVGDWYYKKDIRYKTPAMIIHMLADIVSKNGNLLLNFPLRADGTLDAQEEGILAKLGEWTAINGEAIFGTRPWRVYGEGSDARDTGDVNEDDLDYTADDIRFTTQGKTLYAIALAWPDSGSITIRSLAGADIPEVRMLHGEVPVRAVRTPEGLKLELPKDQQGEFAYAFRLEGAA